MSEHPLSPAAAPSIARQIAGALANAPAAARTAHAPVPWPARTPLTFAVGPAADARDHIPTEILAALRPPGGRLRVFQIAPAAVIGQAGVEGRVRLRIDDGRWSLATVEASIIALLLTVDADVPHAQAFARAFRRAAIDAEARVDAVNAQARGAAA